MSSTEAVVGAAKNLQRLANLYHSIDMGPNKEELDTALKTFNDAYRAMYPKHVDFTRGDFETVQFRDAMRECQRLKAA